MSSMEKAAKEEGDGEETRECCPLIGSGVRCVVTVTCCFFFSCTLGLFYAFGNINPYLTSYLRNRTSDHDLDYTDTMWIFQANTLTSCGLMAPIGVLATRLHPKIFLAITFLCYEGSLFGTYWSLQQSFPLVVVTYGVLGAIPMACVDPVSIRISVGWAPKRKGLICGMVLMGYGVGAVAWNELTTWFINPHNLQPDLSVGEDVYYTQPQVLDNVPRCFLLLGGLCGGAHLLGLLLLCLPPSPALQQEVYKEGGEEEKRRLLGHDNDEEKDDDGPADSLLVNRSSHDRPVSSSAVGGQTEGSSYGATARAERKGSEGGAAGCGKTGAQGVSGQAAVVDYHPWQVLKSRAFWTLWLISICTSFGFIFVISLYKAYGQTFIHDDHFLALVASISAVFNAACRPFWGFLSDRIGCRIVLLITLSLMSALVGSFMTCEVTGKAGFLVWVCGMFVSICGFFTMIYILTFSLFGSRYYNINMGLVSSNGLIGVLLSGLMAPIVNDAFGWHGMFYVGFAGLFVAMLLTMSLSIPWGSSIPQHMWPALDLHPRSQTTL